MSAYQAIRAVHIVCVVLSVSGFALRAAWSLAGGTLPAHGWRHWMPHVNDTLLLAAAIALATLSGQYPFLQGWLTAKIFGLIAYIALGSVALRTDLRRGWRWASLFGALLSFAYVVSVAVSRDPRGFFLVAGN